MAAVGNYLRGSRWGRKVKRNVEDVASIILPPRLPQETPPSLPPGPEPHDLPGTLEGVMEVLGPVVKQRFASQCAAMGIEWPPRRVRLVGLKMERSLELWVGNTAGDFRQLKIYPVLAASGGIGPKRRQGDKQVPEGLYRVVYLNPASNYHLSLLLNYPNEADKSRESTAITDGVNLGGDICVHGSNMSIGCLALGDGAIEEVFAVMALAPSTNRDVLILPADFRKRPDLITLAGNDAEVVKLYKELSHLAQTVSTK